MNREQPSNAVLRKLAEFYAQVDEQIKNEPVRCRQCGECCDFRTNGFRLYTLELERALILRETGRSLELCDGKCSALKDGRCSIHPVRPLGCRTQFCDECVDEIYERAKERIQQMERECNISYAYRDTFHK